VVLFHAKCFPAYGYHNSNYICDLHTEFIQISNFCTTDLLLHVALKEKNSKVLYWGNEEAMKLVHPVQAIILKSSSRNSHTTKLQCGGAPPCWKKPFSWKWATCSTASNRSLGLSLLHLQTTHAFSEPRFCNCLFNILDTWKVDSLLSRKVLSLSVCLGMSTANSFQPGWLPNSSPCTVWMLYA